MKTSISILTLAGGAVATLAMSTAAGQIAPCPAGTTFTSTSDFTGGQIINLNTNVGGQLEVNPQASPLPFLWVAASARGTIIKINTASGQILGEYRSAPEGMARNPSRTTVDLDGAVWAGNRDEAGGGKGSVVKIALVETGECIDRNGNGSIETSTGLGDIRPWPNTGGVDTDGGVETAADECICNFVRVEGDYVRHVSVDNFNNVWTAGNFGADNRFNLLDNATGNLLASFDVGGGGYGGLVDGNGVLWSANRGPGPLTVLRYDTANTVSTADDTWSFLNAPNAYGIAIDSFGNVWNAQYDWDQVRKFGPDGTLLGVFGTGGGSGDRGVAVTSVDDHVWVANSFGTTVSRLDNAGNLLKVIQLGGDGSGPTGVAVDAAGKVWATCLNSSTAKRIDPTAGTDGLGEVDLTVDLGAGAGPYNYSDMTGSALVSVTAQGKWTTTFDGGIAGGQWLGITWNDEPCVDEPLPPGTSLAVSVRAADTTGGLLSQPWTTVSNGGSLAGIVGRYIQAEVVFDGVPEPFATPVLCDLSFVGGCAARGDFNCDGEIGAADMGILIGSWGADDADLDGDGMVTGADLGLLLAAWGPCQ